jgi:hypothetical protein
LDIGLVPLVARWNSAIYTGGMTRKMAAAHLLIYIACAAAIAWALLSDHPRQPLPDDPGETITLEQLLEHRQP